MSKGTRNLLLIMVAIVVLAYTCNHCNPPRVESSAPSGDTIDSLSFITESGDIASSLIGSEQAFSRPDPRLLDSLAREYKTRQKDLLEYIVILENTIAQLTPVDTTKAVDYGPADSSGCPPPVLRMRQRFQSPYYTADVQIGDSSYLDLQGRDTVTVLWKRVRTGGLLARRDMIQLDVSSANPATRMYGLKAYRIQEKPRRFGIGPYVGYGLNGGRLGPSAGLALHYDLIRF